MALSKTTEDDKIEIVGPYKAVHVRTATVIKEDSKELSRSYHRRVLHPGTLDDSDNLVETDVSSESQEIQDIQVLLQRLHLLNEQNQQRFW